MRRMNGFRFSVACVALAFVVLASWGATECFSAPAFYSTGDPLGHWYVSTNVDRSGDSIFASFKTADFAQAVNITYDSNRLDWIADVVSGSHGGVGNWTFFVFRQTFDLTGYDPSTANLQFRWGADDSGEIYADRGSWVPAFSLNGGDFVYYPGASPDHRIPTYGYSDWTSLSSGFRSGLNTIDFYVEGNGQTDGFGLQVASFTAQPVPLPSALLFTAPGLIGLAALRRRFGR